MEDKKWTINDAKDGDVIVTINPDGNEITFMFKEIQEDKVLDYVYLYKDKIYNGESGYMGHVSDHENSRLATDEEEQGFFIKLVSSGFEHTPKADSNPKDEDNSDPWAGNECRLACKKVNPDFNFDGDDFDYICSCYKSALKAYNSLMGDNHSGNSFGVTKNILMRLCDGLPLTPITEEDFNGVESAFKRDGLRSIIQCPRMSGLFRMEDFHGNVTYDDIDRYYFVDIDNPKSTYHSSAEFLNEMYPITLPYYPNGKKYKIYAQTFLLDEKNGDFDTKGIIYMITPEGEKVDLNIFKAEKDGKWVDINKEEYTSRYLLRRR